jgi:cytidylate kinase
MKTSRRSIDKIIEEQVLQWNRARAEKKNAPRGISVVTISRESGSRGAALAEKLAQELGFDLFHREVISEMAESAQISARIVETLDEKGLSVLEDSIAAMIRDRHLWPDQFLKHLMKVIGTIGKHGQAVIVGRGAQFILPPEDNLRVRVIAPMPKRIRNVAGESGVSEAEAQKLILRTDADRRSFSRKYFYADVSDPIHYDLVINTDRMDLGTAVKTIVAALNQLNLQSH